MTGTLKQYAAYIRVSTKEQAMHDFSVPEQKKRTRIKAAELDGEVTEVFIDTITATNDDRREFQRMISMAESVDCPFDGIIVYASNRFARNVRDSENTIERLKPNRVDYISTTQSLENPFVRQVIAAADEDASRNTSTKVQEMMMASAQAGYWNGGPPPFGYASKTVEMRGKKAKKKLVVDEVTASVVRQMYSLYLRGDGQNGPLGTKALTDWLNKNNFLTVNGKLWSVGQVHKLLKSTYFVGFYTRKIGASAKFESPHAGTVVEIPCPQIIKQNEWDAVQAKLKSNNPKVVAPRIVSADHLLTGIARCSNCQNGLTLTTGKSGKYKYYSCRAAHSRGRSACDQPTRIRVDELDTVVTSEIVSKLCDENRLAIMLNKLFEREQMRNQKSREELVDAEARVATDRSALKNLQSLIESGLETVNDDGFSERYKTVKNRLAISKETLARIKKCNSVRYEIRPDQIVAFSNILKQNLQCGD